MMYSIVGNVPAMLYTFVLIIIARIERLLMWTSFIETMLVSLIILYIPGIALLHTGGIKNSYGVLLAPLFSVFMITVIGELFAGINRPIHPAALWIASVVASLAIGFLIAKYVKKDIDFPEISPLASLSYMAAGIAGLIVVYVSAVASPSDFCQSVDMAHHINTVQSFMDSSTFTSLKQSMYMAPADVAVNPWHGVGYYPSAYHVCCALVASMGGVTPALAMNAFNAVLCSIAFPLSMLAIMGYIFEGKRVCHLSGALFVVSLPAFPWDYIVYGPLYPNLFGFSIMMIEAVLLMKVLDLALDKKQRIFMTALFIAGGITLAVAHASAIFFLALLLMPYCIDWIARLSLESTPQNKKVLYKVLCMGGLLIVWMLFFVGLYNTSVIQKMSSFDWGITLNRLNGFLAIITGSYMGVFYCAPAAFVFAGFVIVGFIYTLFNRRYLWISVSYVLLCVALFINDTSDGAFKHFVGSFWYTDPLRFASMAGMVGIILATLGFGLVVSYIMGKIASQKVKTLSIGALVLIAGAFSFLPIDIPGLYGSLFPLASAHQNIERSMGQNLYTAEKSNFVKKAMAMIEPGSLVVNVPGDGSKFAYGADGIRALYRSHGGYTAEADEKRDSKLIREQLNEYATNPEVAHAVETLGVKYVLLLNSEEAYEGLDDETREFRRGKFKGILDVAQDAHGFELILEDGDFKLYKVTGE